MAKQQETDEQLEAMKKRVEAMDVDTLREALASTSGTLYKLCLAEYQRKKRAFELAQLEELEQKAKSGG